MYSLPMRGDPSAYYTETVHDFIYSLAILWSVLGLYLWVNDSGLFAWMSLID